MIKKRSKLVYGVGVNDADYNVYEWLNGKIVNICPFYRTWSDMLKRCYSDKYQSKKPTYKGCLTCDDWWIFSNFKSWMGKQDWEGKQLDKDLLIEGNKLYSPDSCIFVADVVNLFVTDRINDQGDYMLGVSRRNKSNKYRARCCNPFTSRREHLGMFNTELEAHLAWKSRKHELACLLADSEYCTDPRLAKALRARYAN